MGAAQLGSAARLSGRTGGTHRPITGTLLISTQCALCQKSDTVRALWTSSPFKSTQRAFYVLNQGARVHVMVCDCVLCSLSGGQRVPWWTKRRREMRGASHAALVIALWADFLSRQICFDALSQPGLWCNCFTLAGYSVGSHIHNDQTLYMRRFGTENMLFYSLRSVVVGKGELRSKRQHVIERFVSFATQQQQH